LAKGQLFSIDFISGTVIFILSFMMLLTLMDTANTQLRETEDFQQMQSIALAISDMLIKSPGNPENWDSSNVKAVGFADSPHVLNESKILSFYSMSRQEAAIALGLTGYNFNISFIDRNKQIITYKGKTLSIGYVPHYESNLVVSQRVAVLKNSTQQLPVIMRVMLWQ